MVEIRVRFALSQRFPLTAEIQIWLEEKVVRSNCLGRNKSIAPTCPAPPSLVLEELFTLVEK